MMQSHTPTGAENQPPDCPAVPPGSLPFPLILASQSARRRRLLAALGIPFQSVSPDVAEIHIPEQPGLCARENALLKNRWAAERYSRHTLLAADTILEFNGSLMGKPESMEQAFAFLQALSGKTHRVLTAVCLSTPQQAPVTHLETSEVTFHTLEPEVIRNYFTRVNPLDKAGAYDISDQSQDIVRSYTGSLTNIIGLPMEYLTTALAQPGAA